MVPTIRGSKGKLRGSGTVKVPGCKSNKNAEQILNCCCFLLALPADFVPPLLNFFTALVLV